MRPKVLAPLAAIGLAGFVCAFALAGSGSTVSVCAYVTLRAQTVSVNGKQLAVLPPRSNKRCASATVPTDTTTTTVTSVTTETDTLVSTVTTTLPAQTVTTTLPVSTVTATTPSTTVPTPPTTTIAAPTPPTASLAVLWVGNAGSCMSSATPSAYDPATSCGTFDAALRAAPGATILVHCGPYAKQTLSVTNLASMTTLRAEVPGCVSVGPGDGSSALVFGAGVSNVTVDGFVFHGGVYGSSTTGVGNNHIVISGSQINSSEKTNGTDVDFYVGTDIEIINNTIGPSCCGYNANGSSGASPEGIRIGKPSTATASCTTEVCNLKIIGNTIRGVVRDCALYPTGTTCPDTTCPNARGCHEDGIHIWGVDGAQIDGNKLYGDECQGIFLENTNASLNRDVSIIDNAISTLAGGCSNKGIYLSAGGSTDGATNGFAGHWVIAFNSGGGTLIGPNGCGSCWPTMHVDIVGNAMPLFVTNASGNSAGCAAWGPASVTYLYNAWQPGGTNAACGATDVLAATGFVLNAAAPASGIDLHLGVLPTPADSLVPAAVCDAITPVDADGKPRPTTGFCVAGAFER